MVKCMCFLPLCQFHEEGLCCGHVNVSAALACSQVIPHLLRKQSFSFRLNGTLCFDQPWKARQILVFLVVPSKYHLSMFLDPIIEYTYLCTSSRQTFIFIADWIYGFRSSLYESWIHKLFAHHAAKHSFRDLFTEGWNKGFSSSSYI